ncbi:MAG TPA: SDR family oxidoreductase [Chryseolinea sp.]|nr:SDR family oxidoreductase [Chryseolinea sp.]
MKRLKDKTVFITGGLSGIGKACAVAAAKEGANVVVADLRSVTIDSAMKEIEGENDTATFIECDVASMASVEHAIAETIAKFKTLDVALNDAGIGGESTPIAEMTEEIWNQTIRINLTGVFNCLKHELIQMTKQKSGTIINMSSILGKVGFSGSAAYVAAKHGVIGLTQTAALEYAAQGIRINALCPGFVDTPLLTKGGINDNETVKQEIMALHPMNRFGKATEIANAFVFLASDESSFITGTSLEIDGGYLAR